MKEIYLQYCKVHDVPLFFKPFWLNTFHLNWDVFFVQANKEFAFFVIPVEKKMGFSLARNPHLTPYSGLLFGGRYSNDSKQKLTNLISTKFPQYAFMEVDLHYDIGIDILFPEFKVSKKITNILLIQDYQTAYANYKPALKRQINKAKKNIRVIQKDDIELFYCLHLKTFEKQNMESPTPFDAFQKAWNVCKENGVGKLFFAFDAQENIHAALFFVFDKDTAYYLAGGTDAAFYGSGAMSFLMNFAIEHAYLQGKLFFDFEGSMLPNINRFFKNFSPIEKSYLSISKINSTILRIIRTFK